MAEVGTIPARKRWYSRSCVVPQQAASQVPRYHFFKTEVEVDVSVKVPYRMMTVLVPKPELHLVAAGRHCCQPGRAIRECT